MKLKLDESLPSRLATEFAKHGHDVDTVSDEDLTGASDSSVLGAATSDGRMLLTLDRGFGDARLYPPGSHPGIVVLRPTTQDAAATTRLIRRFLDAHDLASLDRCIAVVEAQRVRVRRPGTGDPE